MLFRSAAELAEADLALLECTAQAILVDGLVQDMVAAEMELPDGLAEAAEAQSLGLLLAAEPLFSVEGGNAAMQAAVDAANAERDAARDAGTVGTWFRETFAVARNCYAALPPEVPQ